MWSGVEDCASVSLREEIDEYFLEFFLFLPLFLVQPPHKILIFVKKPLILVHEVSRHLLKVLLVGAYILHLFGKGRFVAAGVRILVELELLFLVLFVFARDIFEQVFGSSFEIFVHINILPL